MTSEKMHYTDRRVKVARDYLAGDYQTVIAERYGVSQGTISNDLKAIRLQWQEEYAATFDTMVAEQLAKIDKIERQAWQAWEDSKKDAETVTQEGTAEMVAKITKKRVGQTGNPQFLQQVQWCIEQRLKIIGGYAKDKREERKLNNEEKWITELIEALQKGRVSPEEVQVLFPDLAESFFIRAGVNVSG